MYRKRKKNTVYFKGREREKSISKTNSAPKRILRRDLVVRVRM